MSGPEVSFKTCVAMKFVDDDDDDSVSAFTVSSDQRERHGRRSRGGQGGHVPPEFGEGGTIMQIVPRRFCHISTKMSVL